MLILTSLFKFTHSLFRSSVGWQICVSKSLHSAYTKFMSSLRHRIRFLHFIKWTTGIPTFWLPWWLISKESACQWRRHRFDLWVGKIPWRRKGKPTPVFLPGKSHGQRSLQATFHPVAKNSDMIYQLNNKYIPTFHQRCLRGKHLLCQSITLELVDGYIHRCLFNKWLEVQN